MALTVSLFPSCGIKQVKEKNSKDNSSKQIELLQKNEVEGTFFRALAFDSLQAISISKKGIVYSSNKPSSKISFDYVEPLIDGESRIYKTKNSTHELMIVIYEDESAREYLDGTYDHSVAISLSSLKEELPSVDFACYGHYIYNDRLSGNWIFQSYQDKRIEELGIDQIPLICIDINTRSFSGSGGNHMIYGDIRCEGDAVFFKIILSPEYVTDMYAKEKELLSVLDSCDRFEIKGDNLLLFQDKEVQLSFLRDVYNS